jgi:predicted nuclease with TOPRIM domain
MSEEQVPIAKLAKVYRKIRERIQEMTQEYEKAVGELKQTQDEVAGAMREQMKAMGVQSVKTEHGLVMLGIKTRYHTQDWDAFKSFIVQHDALDLMEKRIAQGNMDKFLKENPGVIPPGLTSDSEYTVTVRKP